jgi:hypothetical protein
MRLVPLCWLHHRAYDTGRLELLPPYLEPAWRAEVAHAVLHLGLIGGAAVGAGSTLNCWRKTHPRGGAFVVNPAISLAGERRRGRLAARRGGDP